MSENLKMNSLNLLQLKEILVTQQTSTSLKLNQTVSSLQGTSTSILRLGTQQPLAHTTGPRAAQTTGAPAEQLLSCCGTRPWTQPASLAICFLLALTKVWPFKLLPEIHGILEIGPEFSPPFSFLCFVLKSV